MIQGICRYRSETSGSDSMPESAHWTRRLFRRAKLGCPHVDAPAAGRGGELLEPVAGDRADFRAVAELDAVNSGGATQLLTQVVDLGRGESRFGVGQEVDHGRTIFEGRAEGGGMLGAAFGDDQAHLAAPEVLVDGRSADQSGRFADRQRQNLVVVEYDLELDGLVQLGQA